jgi:hypothetical protein
MIDKYIEALEGLLCHAFGCKDLIICRQNTREETLHVCIFAMNPIETLYFLDVKGFVVFRSVVGEIVLSKDK